jgi:opacity protein-like surface antigen
MLDLYGIDSAALQERIDREDAGMADELDLGQLAVREARLQSVSAGVGLRLHFVPRGRFDAWVGSGVGYELFRADYRTLAGDVRVDFHGIGLPAQGGLSVFLTRRFAVGADFEYRWTHFGVGRLQHAAGDVTLPLSVIAEQGPGGADVSAQLPSFWTAGVTARLRV